MKFCPKCNSQYDDGVGFCTRDGGPLRPMAGGSTLKSPGMTLSSGRGSALGASALRTAGPPPRAPRSNTSNAALAIALDAMSDHTPADGLTREVEITPQQPQSVPMEEDVVPGSELDPYADSPTLAIAAPVITVSHPPDGPPRPKQPEAKGFNPGRPVAARPQTVNLAAEQAPPTEKPAAEESYDESEEPDLSGQTIAGRYRVIRRLGEGGMGVVYQAVDERLDKSVALKVLKEDFSRRQDVVARFTQEAKSAARIKHENVLDVTDYGKTESGSYYIAMELLVGTDLADVLQKGEPMTVERATDIAVQICRALTAAHGLGVVHRDMKPENIFLLKSNDGREVVKIVDFGIAQMKDSAGENTRKLTRTGMIFGTPEYMSPEQASGKPIDHRVDVYATGVILYEMFAGRVPFEGDSFMGVLTQHMFEAPPAITDLNPNASVTPEFTAVIFKALAKDPNQRYASMAEFSDDLLRVRQGARPAAPVGDYVVGNALRGPTPAPLLNAAPPGSTPSQGTAPWPASVGAAGTMEGERPRKRSLVPVIAVAVLLIGGAIALAFSLGSQSNPAPVTPPAPAAVVPARPRVTPARPVAPAVTAPAVVVAPPPQVAPTQVAMQIVTDPPGATVHVEPVSGAGDRFTCETPCTRSVATHVPLRLTAQRGTRRGAMTIEPTETMAPVRVTLDPVPTRRSPTTQPSSGGRPTQRRCGVMDPETQLLIPCFPGGSH